MPATRPALNPEWSILLAACSVACSANARPADHRPESDGQENDRQQKLSRLWPLLRQTVRWKALFALAEKHGAQPLLCHALLSLNDALPADQIACLKQSYQANLHKNLLLSRELIRIVQHLRSSGIEVMPYKGLALAEEIYGDVGLRQAGDIDLLIRASDLPRIRQAVGELGYTPHAPLSVTQERAYLKSGYECAFDSAAGRNILEVQWATQPRFYAIDFDTEGLFDRAVTVSVAGQPFKTPCFADLLLILSAHAAKHAWGRMIWLCDIARLMNSPTLDWNWIGSQATKLGIVRILRISMLAANRLLEAAIPPAARACLPQDSAASVLAEEMETRVTSDSAYNVESFSYFRLMMRLRERRRDRLRFLARLAFTPGPAELRAIELPKPLFPLYRLIRLSRLAARMLRM